MHSRGRAVAGESISRPCRGRWPLEEPAANRREGLLADFLAACRKALDGPRVIECDERICERVDPEEARFPEKGPRHVRRGGFLGGEEEVRDPRPPLRHPAAECLAEVVLRGHGAHAQYVDPVGACPEIPDRFGDRREHRIVGPNAPVDVGPGRDRTIDVGVGEECRGGR